MANPLARVRARVGWVDHAVRTYVRYSADGGDRLAAAVTYFGFLSVFPLLALGFSILGFTLSSDPGLVEEVRSQLEKALPGLVGGPNGIDIDQIAKARAGAGLLGLVGLLFAGLGWVDALREAIRTLWHHNVEVGNVVKKKVVDIAVLAGLGLTLAASIAVTGLVSAAADFVIEDLFGFDQRTLLATVVLRAVAIAAALVVDVALFLYVFTRLPRVASPLRRVLSAAVLAAIGFEILKLVGAWYIARTTANPVYGTFAVAVGLLVWINLVSRIVLLCAAWAVTRAGDSDVAPSGTANPEVAEQAGIPPEYAATSDSDEVPALTDDGAPTPLRAAVQGKADTDVYPPPERVPGDRAAAAEATSVDTGPGATTAAAAPRGARPAPVGSVDDRAEVRPAPVSGRDDRADARLARAGSVDDRADARPAPASGRDDRVDARPPAPVSGRDDRRDAGRTTRTAGRRVGRSLGGLVSRVGRRRRSVSSSAGFRT